MLGEALGIYNDGGSLKFDKNGLSISNGTNSFVVNPNDETLISLSNNNGKILWVDTKGGLHLRGDGSGLDITSNEAISGVYSAISQLNDEIVLKVDDNGRLATVKLGADANEGTVVQIGADSINLTAEETINFLSGGEINLSGKNISIKSDNFNVTKDGKMSCKGATIDGDVVANTLTANTKGSLITNYVTNDNLPLYSLRVFILVSSQGTYQAIICRSNTTWFSGIIIPATSQESNKWVFNAIIGSPGTYSLF